LEKQYEWKQAPFALTVGEKEGRVSTKATELLWHASQIKFGAMCLPGFGIYIKIE
jgi:hypothetical protein